MIVDCFCNKCTKSVCIGTVICDSLNGVRMDK